MNWRITPSAYVLCLCIFFSTGMLYAQKEVCQSNWAEKVQTTYLDNCYRLNDEIYRSEQPGVEGFSELESLGIRSILNLRTEAIDQTLSKSYDFHLIHQPISTNKFTEEQLIDILLNIYQAPKPILIHCRHGADRAGFICALYRIIMQGWSKKDAVDEMIEGPYGYDDMIDEPWEFIKDMDVSEMRIKLANMAHKSKRKKL